MKLFLKLLPYLIIVALGFGIYFGFTHYEKRISSVTEENVCLMNKNKLLESQVESLKVSHNIVVEQLESIQNQVKESVNYVSDTSLKIDNLKLDEDKDTLLAKINSYELCVAQNSRNPHIKCVMEME